MLNFPKFWINRLTEVILKNPLIAGSAILFIGTTLANLGSYLYHLLMGRMLGPKDYGALTALISMIYILGIFSSTLNITVVKFVSQYKIKKEYSWVFSLLLHLTKFFLGVGLLVILIFTLGREKITEFLNLPVSFPVILVGIAMLFYFLSAVNDGIIRGLLNFKFLSANLVFASLLKLGLGILFVYWGFSVSGALGGLVLALILAYLLSLWPLSFLKKYRPKAAINWQELGLYATPVLLANLGLTSLYSSDILLVKHFFPPFEAGLYASLSVMGKIVFFASSVVPLVMFPLVSERFENGKAYQGLLRQSLWLVFGECLIITIIFFFIPRLMINILFGPSYLGAAPLLGLFAIFISFYSLSSLLINFFLSIRKVRLTLLPVLVAILQIILIWFFHSSVLQVIQISIFVSALLLGILLLYYLKNEKEEKQDPSFGNRSGVQAGKNYSGRFGAY